MPDIDIKMKGLKELQEKLIENKKNELAKLVVKTNTAELNERIVRNAVFIRGYSTGQTRRSVLSEIDSNGLRSVTQPTTEYSTYLEWGTRFMTPQPFVGPSWRIQKELFIADMKRLCI